MTDYWDEEDKAFWEAERPASPKTIQEDWDDNWIEDTCPICQTHLVLPTGLAHSRALIIGDEPFDNDYITGAPFSGPFGAILEQELLWRKIRMRDLRRMTLWLHKPSKSKECFEYGLSRVLKEATQRQLILLVGAATVRFFTGKAIDTVSGLLVQSSYFPTQVLVACPSPKTVFSSSVGELRFALTEFKRQLEKLS